MNNRRERLKKSSENVVVVTRKRPRPKIVKAVPVSTPKELPVKKKVEKPPSKKKQIDPVFRDRVKRDLNEILPEKMPWKLRIDRDLFHMLKDKYPDERTKLRKMICSILNYRTSAIAYIKVLETAECRYGFDLEEYPLSDEHRESCRKRIKDIRKLMNKRRKKHGPRHRSNTGVNHGDKSVRDNVRSQRVN